MNLHFRYGTDINFALQDASKNLDRARARLPRDADPATLFKFDPSQSPVYEVAFSSPTRSLVDIRNWVDLRLRPQLLTVEGVGAIDMSGGLVREVRVTLDQERLRSYGLAVADVLGALRDQNQDVAAGNLQSHLTSNVCNVAQAAALAALTGGHDEVVAMLEDNAHVVEGLRDALLEAGCPLRGDGPARQSRIGGGDASPGYGRTPSWGDAKAGHPEDGRW